MFVRAITDIYYTITITMKSIKTTQEELYPSGYDAILDRIASIDTIAYSPSRNYIDGAVSYLSPYISRGVISTQFVYQSLLKRGVQPSAMTKFIQELAWRDYWQLIWVEKGDAINTDLKHRQTAVTSYEISSALVRAKTGIKAIDEALTIFYQTGYLHNHLRMYIASIACNIAQNHWKHPAQWMYYYLLDADWASNALSWQWVAGSNSNKKYYANQENINTFCYSDQTGTFLDVSYDDFANLPIPEVLKPTEILRFKTQLPEQGAVKIDSKLPTLIYNFYNLDPLWRSDEAVNRVLLLEPSHFEMFPVSQKTIDFVIELSKNIKDIQIIVGEFSEIKPTYLSNGVVFFKEHPLNSHYVGNEDSREWMFSVKGFYPSFFAFWKKCKKEIQW